MLIKKPEDIKGSESRRRSFTESPPIYRLRFATALTTALR